MDRVVPSAFPVRSIDTGPLALDTIERRLEIFRTRPST